MKNARILSLTVLAAFFSALLLGCGGSVAIKNAMPVPQDRPLYGFTRDGVFFIHESLIANTGAKSPVFVSEVTRNEGRKMNLVGGYYIYNVDRVRADRVDFERFTDKGLSVRYFFVIGTNIQIPREVMEKTDWIGKKDVVLDKDIQVLATRPVDNPHIANKQAR